MNELAIRILSALAQTSICLSLSACVGWLILRIFRITSPRLHRLVWIAVLAQGWLIWKVSLPLLPASISAPRAPSPLAVSVTSAPRAYVDELIAGRTEVIPRPLGADAPIPVNARNTKPMPAGEHAASGLAAIEKLWEGYAGPVAVLLAAAWACGILILVARFLLRYAMFTRWISRAQPAPAHWIRQWQSMLNDSGVATSIPLIVLNAGPVLCRLPGGYQLIVPPDFWTTLSDSQRQAILRHELSHFLRGDIWMSLVARLLLLPHWFNPLAQFAMRRFDECAEWACDDAVRRRQPNHATEYARALLDLTRREPVAVALSQSAGSNDIAFRIRRLVNPSSKEDCLMKRISLVLLVSVLTLAGLIHIVAADQTAPTPPATATDPTAVVAPTDLPAESVEVYKTGEASSAARAESSSVGHTTAARSLGNASQADLELQNAAPASALQRKFKIEVAYLDLQHLFKNLDEFEERMGQLKDEIKQTDSEFRRLAATLRDASEQTREALQQKVNQRRQAKKKEFVQKEARIYQEVFTRVQVEVASYAQERGIRVVRRLKSVAGSSEKDDDSELDAKEVLQRLNRDVIYQADERIDITQEILKRLNRTAQKQSQPETLAR